MSDPFGPSIPTVDGGRFYPEMPPMLEGESLIAYTDRLTGADKTGRVPYGHRRFRQCSIGYHEECSDPDGSECECPCHPERKADAEAFRGFSIGGQRAQLELTCDRCGESSWISIPQDERAARDVLLAAKSTHECETKR